MIAQQLFATSSSSKPGRRILFPSSRKSRSTSRGSRSVTPSSASENGSRANGLAENSRSTSSENSNSLKQPSTFFTFGTRQHSTQSFNPDTPIPSVERGTSRSIEHQSSASTVYFTPTISPEPHARAESAVPNASLRGVSSALRDLGLTTPHPAPSLAQGASPTPSININHSPLIDVTEQPRSCRSDSVTAGFAAMRMESPRANSLGPAGLVGDSSPAPSSRRCSGSGIVQEPHRVESESLPGFLARMTEAQEALISARDLTGRITTVLSNSPLAHQSGTSLRAIHEQAVKLDNFQVPSSRIIGLVGDAGMGKSSLLNSLLDRTGLARVSGRGTSCTCAATEYHFHERNDFVVQVDYFTPDQLRQQFQELLRALRDFEELPHSGSDDQRNEISGNDRKSLADKAKLARDTFHASFEMRLNEMPELLSTMPFQDAIEMMMEWASNMLAARAEPVSFTTVKQCSSWLKQISTDTSAGPVTRSADTRPPWPFVQKIKVYLNAYILSKGLIIADLPGLRDLNSARQAITERYFRQCHHILVVARIERAVTDESIDYILDLASRAHVTKLDIVCTRSEEIKSAEAIDDWPDQRKVIQDLHEAIETLKENIELLKQDARDLPPEDEEQMDALVKERHEATDAKSELELDLQRLVVPLRNEAVSRELKDVYRNHPAAPTLEVFCVSNDLYSKARKWRADSALPVLDLSGIIGLRRHCIGLVGQSRLQAIKTFIKDDIPALIGTVKLWIEAGSGSESEENKRSIHAAAGKIQRMLDMATSPISPLHQVTRTLHGKFDEHTRFNDQGYTAERRKEWSAYAQQESSKWSGWPASSYKIFCYNRGDHKTPTVGSHSWNDEAMYSMERDLQIYWDSFDSDKDTEIKRVTEIVNRSFTDARKVAASAAANISRTNDTGSSMRTFALNMQHREHLVRSGIDRAVEDLEAKFVELRDNALSFVKTSFIGELMEDTYHAANQQAGRGSHGLRVKLITKRFGSTTIFREHQRKCRDKLWDLAEELQESIMEVVEVQSTLIEADMQLLKNENAIRESERNLDFKKRVEEEVRRVEMDAERLGRVVE